MRCRRRSGPAHTWDARQLPRNHDRPVAGYRFEIGCGPPKPSGSARPGWTRGAVAKGDPCGLHSDRAWWLLWPAGRRNGNDNAARQVTMAGSTAEDRIERFQRASGNSRHSFIIAPARTQRELWRRSRSYTASLLRALSSAPAGSRMKPASSPHAAPPHSVPDHRPSSAACSR